MARQQLLFHLHQHMVRPFMEECYHDQLQRQRIRKRLQAKRARSLAHAVPSLVELGEADRLAVRTVSVAVSAAASAAASAAPTPSVMSPRPGADMGSATSADQPDGGTAADSLADLDDANEVSDSDADERESAFDEHEAEGEQEATPVYLQFVAPTLDVKLPAPWWTEHDDSSLILGTAWHGYMQYEAMMKDPRLSFCRHEGLLAAADQSVPEVAEGDDAATAATAVEDVELLASPRPMPAVATAGAPTATADTDATQPPAEATQPSADTTQPTAEATQPLAESTATAADEDADADAGSKEEVPCAGPLHVRRMSSRLPSPLPPVVPGRPLDSVAGRHRAEHAVAAPGHCPPARAAGRAQAPAAGGERPAATRATGRGQAPKGRRSGGTLDHPRRPRPAEATAVAGAANGATLGRGGRGRR